MYRGLLYYLMIPLLALAALFQSTAAGRLAVRGVKPDLVLLLVLIGVLLYGPRIGLIWAFLGGIFLDIFSGGPMGASSLALMAAALVTGLGYRTFSRFHLLVPIGISVIGTIVYGVTYLGVLTALDGMAGFSGLNLPQRRLPFWPTVQYVITPAVLYNTTLMILAIPFLNRLPETQEAAATFQ
jgi:rod shape-determining protein MreD